MDPNLNSGPNNNGMFRWASIEARLQASPVNQYLAPGVRFAFDPQGNGKTAIRAGFGVFYVPLTTYVYSRTATRNAPFSGSIGALPRDAQGRVANFASSLAFVNAIAPS